MSVKPFATRVVDAVKAKNSRLVVGLDPRWDRLPSSLRNQALETHGKTLEAAAHAAREFCCKVIESTADLAAAAKPQIAYFEQFGAPGYQAYLDVLKKAHQHGLLIIGDIKRSDIASTAEAYARGHLGTIDLEGTTLRPPQPDSITINPYLGRDGIQPFLDEAVNQGKGLFALVKTSNPSAADVQDLLSDGTPVYHHVAKMIGELASATLDRESGFSPLGVVVGATYPQALAEVREKLPHSFFLVPGIGAQGGKASDLAPAFLPGGLGVLVNSSRGIIYAFSEDENWTDAVRQAAESTRDAINEAV